VGVRNLLNTVYRDYLNSMRYFSDEMGRNISLRFKIQL
jgi:iron complex outermembrane receptor protein